MSHYYQASEAQNALTVVAKWMSNDKNLKVQYHGGMAVDADVFAGVIRIPRLATASGLTDDSLTILRGRVYHEAGHIADRNILRKIKEMGRWPSGILFEIWNAVEDMRMERSVSERFLGALAIFIWNNNYHNQKISESVANGKELGAIWESLVAMMFQSSGNSPKWRLSDKAQKYFDSAYDKFTEWKSTKNPFETLDLAEEIFEILKETHEEDKKEQEENQDDQDQGDESQEDENQDDQDDQGDEEEEDGGQGEGENDDSENDDSDDSQGDDSNDDEESDEESDEDDNSQSGGQDDFDDEEDSDENNQKDSDSQDSDSDSSDEYDDIDEGENSSNNAGDFDEQELSDEELAEIEAQIIKEMEEELEGLSLEELQDADIEKALAELDDEDTEYLSDKSNDVHKEIKPRDEDAEDYKETRQRVSAAVAAMTSSLQQALLARAQSTIVTSQRRGKLDTNRLPHLIKGLSKNLFYQVEEGEDINTAIEIIIDESASMNYYGMIIPVRQVALAMAEVLTQLDIPFEITGTSTQAGGEDNGLDRTKPMLYKHYKTFNQNWGAVKHAIMQTDAIQNNVDGEAVEYCVHRLQGRPEQRKIVLSLSDGEPYNGQTRRYKLEQHLIRTCEQARKNGVEVYGFGIGTQDPKEFYGEKNFIYLPKKDLDVSFAKAFVDIVTGGRFN